MIVEPLIQRFETLDPETERKCLEKFLYALSGVTRLLWLKNRDAESRARLLAHVSEINHYVLKRVLALANREKDTFFTVKHTWHCVNEHSVPALEEWLVPLSEDVLKGTGA